MKSKFSEEEIVDYICSKLKALLLNKEIFRVLPSSTKYENSDLPSELGGYPLLMKISDIVDATQYSRSTIYELIKQLEAQVPGSVYRIGGKRGIRINRDNFFKWIISNKK